MLVLTQMRGSHDGQLWPRQAEVVRSTRFDEGHQRERLDRGPERDRDLRITDGPIDLTRGSHLDHMAPMSTLDDQAAVDLHQHRRSDIAGVTRGARHWLADGAR